MFSIDLHPNQQCRKVAKDPKELYNDSLKATLVYITDRNGELKQTGAYRKSYEIVQTLATVFPDIRELYVYNVYYEKSLKVSNQTTIGSFTYLHVSSSTHRPIILLPKKIIKNTRLKNALNNI